MKFIKTVESETDDTIKYVYKTDDNLIVESSYINKNDGRDIICVPCQSLCAMGCKFCHTTDWIGKIKNRNLTGLEICEQVKDIVERKGLKDTGNVLLVSYMGCGEPLENYENVASSMEMIYNIKDIEKKTFAFSTCLPKTSWINLADIAYEFHYIRPYLDVKTHFSLHFTEDKIRNEYMPASLNIAESISLLKIYKDYFGQNIEIHYTLMKGVNDTPEDADRLVEIGKDTGFIIKILYFSEKESLDVAHSNRVTINMFLKKLNDNNIRNKYYIPPGLDVGASCGQFLMNHYGKQEN